MESVYDWKFKEKIKINITNGFKTEKISGIGYKAPLTNKGYATIVKSGDGWYVRIGKYQIDPTYTVFFSRGRPFETLEDVMFSIEDFLRRHPRIHIKRKH